MGKRLPHTPNGRIKSANHRLWLQSRERAAALKRDKYSCRHCGAKQSKAKGREIKVEVHHKGKVLNWSALYVAVRKYLLTHPDNLETLCVDCHKSVHEKEGKK